MNDIIGWYIFLIIPVCICGLVVGITRLIETTCSYIKNKENKVNPLSQGEKENTP